MKIQCTNWHKSLHSLKKLPEYCFIADTIIQAMDLTIMIKECLHHQGIHAAWTLKLITHTFIYVHLHTPLHPQTPPTHNFILPCKHISIPLYTVWDLLEYN